MSVRKRYLYVLLEAVAVRGERRLWFTVTPQSSVLLKDKLI